MRSHTVRFTYVRPPFYCRRLTSFYLFVSATSPLPTDMDFVQRFEEATTYASFSVFSLEPHKQYPIVRAKRISN